MNHQNTFYAIIVAGGSGSRMGSETPKQFLEVNGLPILMHTINAFHHNKYQPQIILVLAKADEKFIRRVTFYFSFFINNMASFIIQ